MTSISPPEGQDKTLFTPGPWVADLGEVYCVRANDGRVAIAQHVHLQGRRTSEEVAANARLIAAAPALYEAAVLALELIECIQDEEGFSPSVSIPAKHLRAALNQVRAIP